MNLNQRIKNAGLWQSIQIITQIVIQFCYMAIMARLLSKADFGLMALSMSFISFGMLFSESGMSMALIQKQNLTYKHKAAALQGNLLISFFVFLILYFCAGWIAAFFNQKELSTIIKVVAITVVIGSVGSVSRALLQKQFMFKHISLITLLSTTVSYGIGIIMAYNNYGIWSLVVATMTNSILSSTLLYIYAPLNFSIKIYFKEWKDLFTYGSGVILLGLSNYLSTHGLNLVLGKLFTPTQLGVFERSNSIKTMPADFLGNIIAPVLFPAMSEIQHDKERLIRTFQNTIGVIFSILLPVSVYLIFFTEDVVRIILGSNWLESVIPLQIMFIVIPLSASGQMADTIIRAVGLVYKNVARKFVFVVVLLTTVSIGASCYGVIGASIGVTISFAFNFFIMLVLISKIFKIKITTLMYKPFIHSTRILLIMIAYLLIFVTIFRGWLHSSILKFLLITFFVWMSLFFTLWKSPKTRGDYLSFAIDVLSKKTSLDS